MSKFTTSAGVLLSVGLIGTFSLPAYATPIAPSEMTERTGSIQRLVLKDLETTPLTMEALEVIIAPETISSPTTTQPASAPPSYNGGGLLAAARSQLGWGQDCTALIENSLRMLGYNIGDVAPMGFAAYGTQIDPSQVQPGDIMMRGGHVAIYSGSGMAIHGGFNGSTVETSIDSSPYNYAVIIRL
jgi:hypothetical protein